MKRFAVLLFILLPLASCGRTAPEAAPETTTEIITEQPTTTEPETTTEDLFVPAGGENNGVKWRTLDLTDDTNAELKEELLRRQEFEEQTEFQMGSKKIVVAHEQIVMVDKSGKRTVLLEVDKVDPADEMRWRWPKFSAVLDDRYFLYVWAGWSWGLNIGIYDTKEMKEITIIDETLDGELNTVKVQGDYLYFVDAVSEEDYFGPPHLYAYDWTAIKRGEPVEGIDLLEGFNGTDAIFKHQLLTNDLRYYLAIGSFYEQKGFSEAVRIYDLDGKKLLTALPEPDFSVDKLEEWNGKIYWVEYINSDYALEITLP